MRRFLTLFVCNAVLWAIVTQFNHMLTGVRIHLFVGALFVTYAALTQPLGVGLWVSLLSGLVFDANTPVGFGTHMVLFGATHVVVFRVRERVARNETISRIVVAVLANLGLFLAFGLTRIGDLPVPSILWPRFFIELACSQVFLAFVAIWFFAFQTHALAWVGIERDSFA